MSWTRKILLILGFLSTLAAIALITVAVTQNQPLPKNTKVLQAGAFIGKQAKWGFECMRLWDMLLSLLGLSDLSFWLQAP